MQNTIDINKKTLVDNVSENAAMLVSDHGKLVRYPIKKISGNRIFIYALGYGKDVEVGSYKMDLPPDELINEGIDYGDIIVDTDGGCIFQYVPEIGGDGDDGASLPAEGLHCIANPNGEKGDKGDKGEQGTQGVQGIKGKDGFLGNEYKGEYPDDVLYGDSDTVTFNSYTKANIGDYIIAEPSVMTQFGNAISLWMCTECEDIYGNGNEYKLTFKRKFSYGNVLPAVGEYIQKRVLVTENGSQPKWEDFPDSMVFKGGVNALPTTANEGDVYIVSPWENVDTYSDISMSLSIRSVSFSEWNGLANFLYSDVQSNYGCSYKFVIGGASYIYTECGDISASEEYFEMKGTTDDVASVVSVSGETVTVYKADAGADMIKKSYIYHNGKWEVGSEVYDDLKILSKIANLESGKANVTHNHSASNITSGALWVSRGGTGKSSWSTNRIIYPSASTTMSQLAFPTEESFLAQKSSGAPYWVKRSEIGGASGAMVYKGKVDTLPQAPNEQEVYKASADLTTVKTYQDRSQLTYGIDYIGDDYIVIYGNLWNILNEMYNADKQCYLMFYNGEYEEEFIDTITSVEGSTVYFKNGGEDLQRVFSSTISYAEVSGLVVCKEGEKIIYYNGEWVEL